MANNCKIALSEEAYQRIMEYAEVAGIALERAASEAVNGWMDSTGDLVMEELPKRRKARAAKPKLTLAWDASLA